MHFGLHLHRKGLITADELVAALEVQTRNLVRIGQLALEEGILTARDIFDVLRAQHRSPNARFGELAIDMGLMSHDNLMQLLLIQTDRKLPLSEILIWQGVLTGEQVDEELNALRKSHERARPATSITSAIRAPHSRPVERLVFDSAVAN
jgi:hypothetical protein